MSVPESQSEPGLKTFAWLPLALVVLAFITGAAMLLSGTLSLANLAFLFLLPVIAVSGRHGLLPGLLTAALASIAFNFFLVPPRFTLHIADVDNAVTMAILFAVAVAVSNFAARLQAQARLARQRANESDALARLTLDLAQQPDEAAMYHCLADHLEAETGCLVAVFDASEASEALRSASPIDLAASRWAVAHSQMAGRGTSVMGSADSLYVAARTGDDNALLVRLWRGDGLAPVSPTRQAHVSALTDRCGQALERLAIASAKRQLEARERDDAMREALLASFSHDLRTPLTTLSSGVSALVDDPGSRTALGAVQDGATRLDWLFTNLVDLARIKVGAIALRLEPVDLTDAIASALDALARQTAGHDVKLEIPDTGALIRSDARLLHHILVNLIDNACKYALPSGAIEIAADEHDGALTLAVRDHGPGLDTEGSVDLFLPYQRGDSSDGKPGSGLGLAIVAGFARALGITVSGTNRIDGQGAEFLLAFPASMVMHAHMECPE